MTDPPVPGVVVVTVRGMLTGRDAGHLRQAANALLATLPRMIILELNGIIRLDPAGAEALVAVACEAGDAGIGLSLVIDPPHRVVDPLEAIRRLDLFEIHRDVAATLDTLRL